MVKEINRFYCTKFKEKYASEKIMRLSKSPKNTEYTSIPTYSIPAKYLDDSSFRLLCFFYSHVGDDNISVQRIKKELQWTQKDIEEALETLIEYKFISSD